MVVNHWLNTISSNLADQRKAREDQLEQQRWHQRSFGIMKKLAIAKDIVTACRGTERAIGEIDEIFDDRARLDQRAAIMFDHRRFAERVDPFERGRREQGFGIALIALDFICQA